MAGTTSIFSEESLQRMRRDALDVLAHSRVQLTEHDVVRHRKLIADALPWADRVISTQWNPDVHRQSGEELASRPRSPVAERSDPNQPLRKELPQFQSQAMNRLPSLRSSQKTLL